MADSVDDLSDAIAFVELELKRLRLRKNSLAIQLLLLSVGVTRWEALDREGFRAIYSVLKRCQPGGAIDVLEAETQRLKEAVRALIGLLEKQNGDLWAQKELEKIKESLGEPEKATDNKRPG